MKRTVSLAVALAALAACAYKLPEAEVLRIFERHSYARHDPEKLRSLLKESGAEGLRSLDRHAAVLKAGPQARTSPGSRGMSAGLLVGEKGGAYFLLRVFKGSPAEAAGLKEGDKLVAVNSLAPGSDGSLKALSEGRELSLKVARSAKSGVSELEASVKAAEFGAPLFFGLYEPVTGAALVRVGVFSEGAAAMVAEGLGGMLRRYGAKSVVLDLRGNPGGSPEEAAALLALFAPKAGPVLLINSRHKGYSGVLTAPSKGRFAGLRAAVLVDSRTSMTGEVAAAALKELAGAVVVGGSTAGNVSVQKTFALGEGRGLRLTVARLAPPSGADLEGGGLPPDEALPDPGPAAWGALRADALLNDAAYKRALAVLGAGSPSGTRR